MLHQYVKSLHSYNPIPGGCVLYLPLWHPNLGGLKYKSIDPFGHVCTRTASGILHFDGSSNSSVDFGAIHDATDKLWVSFWFKLDAPFSSASPTTQELFAKYVNGTNYFYCYLDETDGKLYLDHGEGAGPETISSTETTWAADTWHHIIASMSTAAGQRMIVNGGTAVAGAGNQTAISLVASIVFGAAEVDSASYFVGEIKEVVMGTDDLSAPEEAALYAGTLPGDETEYYPMNEGSGDFCYDQEGTNDADGDIDDACTWENVPMHQRANGHYFDGFDDNISIPDHVAFDTTTQLSVFAWVKLPDATPAGTMRVIGKYITTGAKREWDTLIDSAGKLSISFGDPADGTFEGSVLTNASVFSDNVFTLVGFTFNGENAEANRVVTYKDGSVVANSIVTAVPASLWNETADVRMGESNSGGEDLTGTIGEVWIYNRILSATEALFLSDKTKGRYL